MANGLSLVISINGGQWICPFNFHLFGHCILNYFLPVIVMHKEAATAARSSCVSSMLTLQSCWFFFVVYLEKVHRPGNKAVLVHCIELPEFTKARTYILLLGYILACFKRTTINTDFTIGPWVLQITNGKSWVTIRAIVPVTLSDLERQDEGSKFSGDLHYYARIVWPRVTKFVKQG